MEKRVFYLLLMLLAIITSCHTLTEYVMPFRNLGYSGERIFPVQKNDAQFMFRAFINFSSSVERIVTISKDSTSGYRGELIEIIHISTSKDRVKESRYIQKDITPNSGFETFIKKIDSLQLMNMNDQTNFGLALHRPFSLYVIEIKQNGRYNQFRFNTHFPVKLENENTYDELQRLILKEFTFKFYFPEKQ